MKKKVISILAMICLIVTIFPLSTQITNAATKVIYSWPTSNHKIEGKWGLESGHSQDYHFGIDIGAVGGSRVKAAAPGRVIHAGLFNGYGYCVQIQHDDGKVSLYGHMRENSITVKTGQSVSRGDILGKVGGTGLNGVKCWSEHLHFGLYKNASVVNNETGKKASDITYNPLKYLKITYTLKYSDGLSSTQNDSKIIPPDEMISGIATQTTTKKFTRPEYTYNSWYIFKKDKNGYINYWCRDKATKKKGRWYKYNEIPSTYYKVKIAYGAKLIFSVEEGATLYLTPVWERAKYTLKYSDGLPETQNDSSIIPPDKMISGIATQTTTKKFTRPEYTYNSWYIFKKDKNGYINYWCRDKATKKKGRWYKYNEIPSTYYKVKIVHGAKLIFSVEEGVTLYLTPVWERAQYNLEYSDGLPETQNDSSIIPPDKMTSGVATQTTTKKFIRDGYTYDSWYIFKKDKNGDVNYWCRDKETKKKGKWYKYNEIPSTYYKVKISHGGKLFFSVNEGTTLYLIPVWERAQYNLEYSDGLPETQNDSSIIPPDKMTSGVATQTTTKKFIRDGYTYDSWYIFKRDKNGDENYWCQNKTTVTETEWYRHDKIPSTYDKIKIAHGSQLNLLLDEGATIYLTPVWEESN